MSSLTKDRMYRRKRQALFIYAYFLIWFFVFCLPPSMQVYPEKYDSVSSQVESEDVHYQTPVIENTETGQSVEPSDAEEVLEVEVSEHIETVFSLSQDERYIVEQVVMRECGNEPYEGIVAVAQCIYNTAIYKEMSPAGVVSVPGQYASPSKEAANENVKMAVSQVFDLEEFCVEEPIMFFYAPKYSAGTWHESSPNLEYACTIGGHKFFKLKGA